jgi:Tfp pilus assembly protein FimT
MRHAFTIVEPIVRICIVGVISAIAMPSVGKLLDRVHVRGAVLEIESLFSGTRHIAIARSAQTTVDRYRQSGDLLERWCRHASEAGDWKESRSSALGDSCADVLLSDWFG